MKALFILDDAPYGSECSYNVPRLAGALARVEGNEVREFLIGDAAACVKSGQNVAHGYYNVERMVGRIARQNGSVGVCGTCMNARGITETELTAGTRRSTLDELADWTVWADKVIAFSG